MVPMKISVFLCGLCVKVVIICAVFGLLSFSAQAETNSEPASPPILTILYTAEAHAALLPCDCPVQPLGGVARRATLIKRYRERGPVLLIDAGGWAAGGIYDEESDGDPERDKLRTKLMAQAMKLMKYDITLLGTAEAGAGVETAILPSPTASHIATSLSPQVPQGVHSSVMVFGWSEPGTSFFGRPTATAPTVWNIPTAKSPFEIHLSRLGEEGSEALAKTTQAHLIINAGRKSSQRIFWNCGNTTLVNFDYQAQRLGVVEIFPADMKWNEEKNGRSPRRFTMASRFEALIPAIPDDPEITALLAPHLQALNKKGKKRVDVEFWTMPECPGCIQAWPGVQRMVNDFSSRVDVAMHFVVQLENGKLGSLHGERELNEARIQILVNKYYKEKIWDWLVWRDKHREDSWEVGANALSMLTARIRGALKAGEADRLLKADFELMQRRRVEGTPSLVIANRLYDGSMQQLQILRVLCGLLEAPAPAACKDVPACFFDAQCKKRGFIGRCLDAGKASARCDTSQPAVKVPATVILDKENLYSNHERIMEALIGDLPGIEFKMLDYSDPDARVLVETLKLARLPAYVLDPVAKKEEKYADGMGKIVVENESTHALVVRPFAVGSHHLLNRQRIKGRADLFVSRFSKNGQEALETAIACKQSLGAATPELALHDALYWKEPLSEMGGKRELAASAGLAELEDAARAMAIKMLAPERLDDYFLERGKHRGSSYWDKAIEALGMDVGRIRALAEESAPEILLALYAEADLLKSLDAGGDITLLAENCELIVIRSRQDLREILERIGQRRTGK